MTRFQGVRVKSADDAYCAFQGIIKSGKSTLTATISMVDKWQQAMEKELSTGVLQFDLSAAFDGIMARKLTSLNLSDQSLMWVKSYLGVGSNKCR
jgi:hypothetical protein